MLPTSASPRHMMKYTMHQLKKSGQNTANMYGEYMMDEESQHDCEKEKPWMKRTYISQLVQSAGGTLANDKSHEHKFWGMGRDCGLIHVWLWISRKGVPCSSVEREQSNSLQFVRFLSQLEHVDHYLVFGPFVISRHPLVRTEQTR